jgi:hypothetical protein
MMFVLLAGCAPLPDTVVMSGAVSDAPYGEGAVVGGAALEVLDASFETIGTATADDAGAFSVDVPAGVPFFLEVSGDGYVPTSFSGTAGVYDFAAPTGYPWVASEAWLEAIRTDFVGCPTVDDAGVVFTGEVRVDTTGYAYTDMPIESTGTARAVLADDTVYDACYLDDDGVYSADATTVGAKGRFAIFGVPAGPVILDLEYTNPGGDVPVELFQFIGADDGVVPLYPALVELTY